MADIFSKNDPGLGDALDERRSEARLRAGGEVKVLWYDEQNLQHSFTAQVIEASENGCGLLLPYPLRTGQIAWIVGEDDKNRKIIVRHCKEADEGWRIGVFAIDNERRRADRTPVSGKAELIFGVGGVKDQATVEVVDVSEFGAQIDAPQTVELGSLVQLVGETYECSGRVRHAEALNGRWRIGVQFTQEPFEYATTHSEDWID